MSIYPVYLASWFPRRTTKPRPAEVGEWWDKEQHTNNIVAETVVKLSKCERCKKKCKWKQAWGHHSIPYGHGEIWCSKTCLIKHFRELRSR